jgi:CIC family chloride channel protein
LSEKVNDFPLTDSIRAKCVDNEKVGVTLLSPPRNRPTSSKPSTRSRMFKISLIAILVGILGGVGAIVFRLMIDLNKFAFFDLLYPVISSNSTYTYLVVLLPALGALIVGAIVAKFALEAKGHGIPQVMECVAFKYGRMRYRVAGAKIIASSIMIGSGGSAGREGPIAQIGAAFGSMSGQTLKLSDRDVELLVVCGLAAGIAATFNAPLGGAIFGLEILFRRFEVMDAMPVLLSCVFGTLMARIAFGNFVTFVTPVLGLPQFHELFLYAVIGLVFGGVSALWVRLYYFIEKLFERMKAVPFVLRVALGGLVTGLIGLPFFMLSLTLYGDNTGYGIYGSGYEGINLLLAGAIPLALVIVLGLVKMTCTSFSLGSGGSGGLLVPTLYIGSMLGGTVGLALSGLAPGLISEPYAFALVGAATLFAGSYGTPIASIVLIPEMSLNFTLLLPLMLSCTFSHLVARRLLHGSTINTLALELKGTPLRELTGELRKNAEPET